VTQFTVTPDYIADAATHAHRIAADIQSELSALKSYVEELGAAWLGVASGTFVAMMTNYQAYANNLHDALDDIGYGLQGNYVNYVDMEQQNLASLVPIDGVLPPMNLTPVPTGPTPAPGDFTLNP
jgi:WXG100 family type VII secretion target